MTSVNIVEFRDRYPKASLPHWLDTVTAVSVPSEFCQRETRIWVTALFWAMGNRTLELPDMWDREEAERLVQGFGEPVDA
jgi:hypothetical protein